MIADGFVRTVMKGRLVKKAVLVVAITLLAVVLSGCSSGIDPWRLQGTWEASVTNGNTTTVTHRLIIDGDTFHFAVLTLIPTGKKGTFSVDAFARPKEIDLFVSSDYIGEGSLQIVQNHDPAVEVYGIYEISKGVLKIQLSGDGARPVSFDSDEAVTLKRVDKG